MPRFERARKPEEKEQRKAAILRAAVRLARENGPIALGLNELAREAGITKWNIYRYFESREEILGRIYLLELEELVEHLERLFPRRTKISEVAAEITRAFLALPLFCQLLGMLSSILEHNIGVETIAASKREMATITARVLPVLERALPWLGERGSAWVMQTIAIYVATLWPAAHPSNAAAEVFARPEFAAMKPDAASSRRRFIEVVLTGLECTARQ
ncbi:MAG: Transcriptional regulator, TetR family protein [bacterium]|nr:Transcriptional regulator, TetR family protein [bacterium]